MGVGVQRERGFRVAQNAGERFSIYAAGQRVSGEGVPEIVKAHIGQPCFRQQLFHAGVTAVRHDGVFRVDRVREDPPGDGCPFSLGQQLHRAGR